MDLRPEKFDVDFWKQVLTLVGRLAMLGVVLVGGAGGTAELADRDLRLKEKREGIWAAEDAHGEYMQEVLTRQAACDTALEMYDGPADWRKVLKECHSGG